MTDDGIAAMPRVLAIVGPTASGKSGLAQAVARRFAMDIVNCDSVQVYRGLDIGSAKPSPSDRAESTHHMLDLVEPDREFSAGDYARSAQPIIASAGRALICGGTGLYLRTLAWTQTGMPVSPLADASRADETRAQFESEWMAAETRTRGAIHAELARRDPPTAAATHPNNLHRALRALWLCKLAGEPISGRRQRDPPRPQMRVFMVVLDPGQDALAPLIERRCRRMMAAGWLNEVRGLLDAGFAARHKAMQCLGYRQLVEHLQGQSDLETAVADTIRATRQYARRQRTYFRCQLTPAVRVDIRNADEFPWQRAAAFIEGKLH